MSDGTWKLRRNDDAPDELVRMVPTRHGIPMPRVEGHIFTGEEAVERSTESDFEHDKGVQKFCVLENPEPMSLK